jgi:hypothetical protein
MEVNKKYRVGGLSAPSIFNGAVSSIPDAGRRESVRAMLADDRSAMLASSSALNEIGATGPVRRRAQTAVASPVNTLGCKYQSLADATQRARLSFL